MFSEFTKAIKAKYDTITYNSGLLKNTAVLYFGTAPDDATYPFTNFNIRATRGIGDSCNDMYDFLIQFSVFDNSKSPQNVLEIGDAINTAYNNTSLTGLDGDLLIIRPFSAEITERLEEEGHACNITYYAKIEKAK